MIGKVSVKTTYAGLNISNPLVVSSSWLTNSVDNVLRLEKAGIGAIVLKSLFEEQIRSESEELIRVSSYPVANEYITAYTRVGLIAEYTALIRGCKAACTIPIIASINCHTVGEWGSYARSLQVAGADALELNIFFLNSNKNYEYGAYEQQHVEIVKSVRRHTTLPLIVKIGSQITNPVCLIDQLRAAGASAVVLFNRFYNPDIDIDRLNYSSGEVYSSPTDFYQTLRWTGLVSANVPKVDIAASSAIFDAETVIKCLLAGANVAYLCSTIYKNGIEVIAQINAELEMWMYSKDFKSIAEFRGLLNAANMVHTPNFDRHQFMKYASTNMGE